MVKIFTSVKQHRASAQSAAAQQQAVAEPTKQQPAAIGQWRQRHKELPAETAEAKSQLATAAAVEGLVCRYQVL